VPIQIRSNNSLCKLAATNFDIGRLDDSIAQYEQALHLLPDSAPAHRNLGYVLLRMPGETDGAVAHFEAALYLGPIVTEARIGLSTTLSQRADREGELQRQAPRWVLK
jgi:tetratricopeptide (TPR) repeat protein